VSEKKRAGREVATSAFVMSMGFAAMWAPGVAVVPLFRYRPGVEFLEHEHLRIA
jgi:hypothetical protein